MHQQRSLLRHLHQHLEDMQEDMQDLPDRLSEDGILSRVSGPAAVLRAWEFESLHHLLQSLHQQHRHLPRNLHLCQPRQHLQPAQGRLQRHLEWDLNQCLSRHLSKDLQQHLSCTRHLHSTCPRALQDRSHPRHRSWSRGACISQSLHKSLVKHLLQGLSLLLKSGAWQMVGGLMHMQKILPLLQQRHLCRHLQAIHRRRQSLEKGLERSRTCRRTSSMTFQTLSPGSELVQAAPGPAGPGKQSSAAGATQDPEEWGLV